MQDSQNIGNSLKEVSAELELLYSDHKLSVAPYVVIFGPNLSNISSAYTVIGQHTYEVATPLDAVNLCFQSVKVFRKEFSNICNHVWQFLERHLYNFDVPNPYGAVSQVIDKLSQV